MKIAPICLLTACKRRKFKLFGDSSQGSCVVIDQQALATGYVHWKRTVPYSNVVQKTAQTICTGYKENIMVLESGYFFDYLCHWNWFLLSLLILILFLYFFNSPGRVPRAGNSLRAEKSHWQVQKVTLAGPKSHTRAKMSHWSVMIVSRDLTYIIMTAWFQIIFFLLWISFNAKMANGCCQIKVTADLLLSANMYVLIWRAHLLWIYVVFTEVSLKFLSLRNTKIWLYVLFICHLRLSTQLCG